MGVRDYFRRKALPASNSIVSFDLLGAPIARNTDAYVKEGYEQNPVVYACVMAIMKAVASIKLEVHSYAKDGSTSDVQVKHPVLALLAKPNPLQSGREFIQEMVMWHRVAGEVFILRLPSTGKPVELYCLDPRQVNIKRNGASVTAYEYGSGADKKVYPVNVVTGDSQVRHIKTPNACDPFRGFPPMAAAARQVDTHNAGGRWNANLLNNSARPSGVIELPGVASETLLSQLRNYVKRVWQGAANAGNIPLLTGGAKFTALSFNPKDMDFQNNMSDAAKNIALVYGVPLPLVTMEASTFSNMETALERFWTDTVLPLTDELLNALSDFLLPFYGKSDNVAIAYNADSIPAMDAKRARMFDRMGKGAAAGLVTLDEGRAELGYEEMGGNAAELLVPGTLTLLSKVGEKAAPAEDAVGALAKALKAFGYSDDEAQTQAVKDVRA